MAQNTCDLCNEEASVEYDRSADHEETPVPRFRHYCTEHAVTAIGGLEA